jgi:hypothetical protein
MRLSRAPVDSDWLRAQLSELEQLAEEGDTLEVVAKLGSIVREPKREAVSAPQATTDAGATVVRSWTPEGSSPD